MKNAIAAILCVSALGFSAWPAFAQNREAETTATPAALERVYACAATASEAERLACYDSAVAALRGAQSSGEVVAIDRGNVERLQRDSFGFNVPSIANLLPRIGHDDNVVRRVEMTVTRVSVGPSGRSTFYMSDGSVWTQVNADRVRNVRQGDTVTVERASLGSFLLSSPRGGMGHRIRRAE